MPVAHQLILAVIVAGFLSFPIGLFYGWIVTRGWEQRSAAPLAKPAAADDAQEHIFARAA